MVVFVDTGRTLGINLVALRMCSMEMIKNLYIIDMCNECVGCSDVLLLPRNHMISGIIIPKGAYLMVDIVRKLNLNALLEDQSVFLLGPR